MRPVVFLWENFGPYHLDRLRGVAASGRRAIGLQYARTSETYDWVADAGGLDLRTLGLRPGEHGWRLAWRLWRAGRRIGRADLFFCHYQHWPVLLAAIALRLTGGRLFAMFESKHDDYPRHFWREAGKRLFLIPYTGALVPTPRSRAYLAFLGLRGRIATGYSTVAIDRIRAAAGTPPAPAGLAFDQREWVVVARLVPKKNIALAIDAHARWLATAARPRDLHLLGSGPLEAELREQAARLGTAARVYFHGFVQSDAVARRLAGALALLLPSTEEQFGLAVIEAQAMGLPVLLTPAAGAADVLVEPGVDGFLLAPDDPAGWAAAMALLAEDEGRWRAMTTAAAAGADRGDVARFVEGVTALTG